MTQVGTVDTVGEGVILSPSPRQKSRAWCFTLNNYEQDDLTSIIKSIGKAKYVIGKEVGTNGTPHLQGYIYFENARSFSAIQKLIPRAHIEKAKGSKKQNFTYCSKNNDYETNMDDLVPFEQKMRELCLAKYKNVIWKPWQQEILDLINTEPDDRSIYWYHDSKGNVGKTFLSKYICITKDVVICDGKKDNVFNQVKTMIDQKKVPVIILLDIPRSSQGFVNYGCIEKLKDGLIYSGKYEGGQCIFPSPHVIVFSNEEPITSNMSVDRWVIREV